MNRPNLVFTFPEYRGMQATLRAASHNAGDFEVDHFPDGERDEPSFHLDDENLDSNTWRHFLPIHSSGFELELTELDNPTG